MTPDARLDGYLYGLRAILLEMRADLAAISNMSCGLNRFVGRFRQLGKGEFRPWLKGPSVKDILKGG